MLIVIMFTFSTEYLYITWNIVTHITGAKHQSINQSIIIDK